MNGEQFESAIRFAVNRIVETLEKWQEPWAEAQDRNRLPQALELRLFEEAFGASSDVASTLRLDADIRPFLCESEAKFMQRVLANSRGCDLARAVLATLGIEASEDSTLFKELSVRMAKLQIEIHHVMEGRSSGDHSDRDRLVNYYRRIGYVPSAAESAAAMTPTISEAWQTYSAEKRSGPKPKWSHKTAEGQEAAFTDWRDIIGDMHVGEVTRETMLRYRSVIAQLPANRHKRYPGKSIAELQAMNIPADQLPSDRTVQEKLIQLGAFLKWCRDVKGYLTTDPMVGVHFDAESQSYAQFTRDDLQKMFNGPEYTQGTHSSSWRFWLPLLALYTGARQTELAQLTVRNVVQEDGVWLFSITDAGDGQNVKTRAGIRKVPIGSKLRELGFLDYLDFLKERGETRLFPDLEKGTRGWGQRVSKWFNATFRKSAGIESDPSGASKNFHSFRHTAMTKAMRKVQNHALTQQTFGHEKKSLGESATYMHEFPVSDLVPVIEALDYGLDHSGYTKGWRDYAKGWPAAFTPATQSAHTSARVRRAA